MLCKLIDKLKGKRKPHLEVFQGLDDEWYTRIVAANGEILMLSQHYSNESNAWRAVRVLAVHTGLTVKENK